MNFDFAAMAERAKAVLDANWMGKSTKPAPNLYPHQWSWDSAFIAIGYSHYDQRRAQTELKSLFEGQWRNGLLPHIVFNPEAGDYKPGPEFWQTHRSAHASRDPLTSGLMQPPVHATAVLHVYEHGSDRESAREFLEEMYPKLQRWHTYMYTNHRYNGDGLIYIRHPWGSGQDNSPIWDRILNGIELAPDDIPEYQRVDKDLVDSADRPSDTEYDRYAYLVKVAYENEYDESRIREVCPFLVEDVLFNTAAVKSNHDLAKIAEILGDDPGAYRKWAQETADGLNNKLWSDAASIYFDYDLVADSLIDAHVAAGMSPIYAGIPTQERAEAILSRLNSQSFCRLDEACLSVPSYDKEKPGYEPNRYWRGPIWINVNYLLFHGLRRYGLDDYAERIKYSIYKLVSDGGIYEYYDPDTGAGHGASDFSWTAALLLDLLYEEEGLK